MPTIKTLITYLLFLLFTVYAHAKTTYTISELPAPIKQKIEPQLKEFFKEDLEQVKFEALAGGMSGTPVYKATLKDNIYVVRVYGDNELAAYETTLLTRIAGNHQFGSKVYYPLNNKPTRILISGFANGKAPNPSEYPQYKNNLAKSLRELHSITTQALPMGANLFVRSRASLSKVGQLGPFLEGLSIINKIENALTRSPFRFGITHQDLNTLNFLYDGKKFTYIDWADGGFGDQMGDVANLTLEFGLDDKQA
ncbi:MAG: hypothetical protein JSR17_09510, partial [Proteobacteria bacterium]|nr:hypothetical protein [Pseudomonadota bacterium]